MSRQTIHRQPTLSATLGRSQSRCRTKAPGQRTDVIWDFFVGSPSLVCDDCLQSLMKVRTTLSYGFRNGAHRPPPAIPFGCLDEHVHFRWALLNRLFVGREVTVHLVEPHRLYVETATFAPKEPTNLESVVLAPIVRLAVPTICHSCRLR